MDNQQIEPTAQDANGQEVETGSAPLRPRIVTSGVANGRVGSLLLAAGLAASASKLPEDPDYRSPSQRAAMSPEEIEAYFQNMEAKERERNHQRELRMAQALEESRVRHEHFIHNQKLSQSEKAQRKAAKRAEAKAAKRIKAA